MGRFNEKDFEFAPSWRPIPGDILEGTVTERSTRATEYGEYPILTLETESGRTKDDGIVAGEISVHAIHTALKNQVEDLDPKKGDYVGILFQGKIAREDAEDFFGYRLKVTRNGGSAGPDLAEPLPSSGGSDDEIPF
jgi:hypothetical protein